MSWLSLSVSAQRNAIAIRRHTVPVNGSGMSSVPFSGYALRRVTVAPDLDALRGPLHGRFQLPLHFDASARAECDFASSTDRELAYRLWPDLYLPRVVRAAWQAEHPVPARIGAGPQVPQL